MKKLNEAVKVRAEKIEEYKKLHNVPKFDNPDDYFKWLETTEGKEYAKALENIRDEVNKTVKGRGGYRPNAGRKKIYGDRIALNKRVEKNTVVLIKDYSKNHNISENEALEKLINAGYEYLEKHRQAG